MYDFHKRKDKDNIFFHKFFVRGKPEQLKLIKRKLPAPEDLMVVPHRDSDFEAKQFELEEWCKRIAQQNEQICK
jgi:hypothetical protein